jgi:hypothetical protein
MLVARVDGHVPAATSFADDARLSTVAHVSMAVHAGVVSEGALATGALVLIFAHEQTCFFLKCVRNFKKRKKDAKEEGGSGREGGGHCARVHRS